MGYNGKSSVFGITAKQASEALKMVLGHPITSDETKPPNFSISSYSMARHELLRGGLIDLKSGENIEKFTNASGLDFPDTTVYLKANKYYPCGCGANHYENDICIYCGGM